MLTSSAGLWNNRRLVLLAAGLVIAASITLILTRSEGLATSSDSPYTVPPVKDTNPNPNVVETTLVADEATVNIGNGISARAQAYNGTLPGPTFRLKVGDTVIVRFENRLNRETGVHWHGIEVSNGQDGTPFTQNQVEPGGSFLYKFTVTRPGIFWYHPHHHASTNQVFKGLYGLILVEDPNENQLQANGTLPPAAQTHPVVLSDTTACKAPGTNDDPTYNLALPHVSGNPLAAQAAPTAKNLCEGPAVGADPYPVDEDGDPRGPFAAGDIPNLQTKDHAGRVNEGQTVLTNGMNVGARAGSPSAPGALATGARTLQVRPGAGLRLQLLNASAMRYMRLRLTNPNGLLIQLRKVGGEGGLLNAAVTEGGTQGSFDTKFTSGEILLPPGTRADVVAAIPTNVGSGVMTLWTEDYNRTGLGFSNIPTVPVMHFNLGGVPQSPAYTIPAGTPLRNQTGDPVPVLGPANGNLLTPGGFTPPKLGSGNQNIRLTAVANTEAGVDGVRGDHEFPGIDYKDAPHLASSRYAKQGDILQLSVQNQTLAHHPFHLHGFSIQPLSLDGPGAADYTFPYPEFRDNVDIPGNTTLHYRVRIDPKPLVDGKTAGGALGRWVFHCHIFNHATDGMISELVVASPSGNERPDINVNGSFATVRQGRAATATGTFKDRDGNTVNFSSSVGTVANTGGGTFRWRWAKPAGPDRLVFITATDQNGLKGQIPLHVNKFPEVKRLRIARRKRLRFSLTEPARVRFTIKRIGGGPTKRFRSRFPGGGGKNIKIPGRALPGGRYLVIAAATDRTGIRAKFSRRVRVRR
jgi:FtsP/CotA-like multicopper oxidase with cupredoxin domain